MYQSSTTISPMKLFLPLLAALAFLSGVVTAQPPKEVPELDALNESWLAEREKALRPIDAKYEVALQRLRDRLTKSGDLHGALAVDKEIEERNLLRMEWTKLSSIKPKESKVGWEEMEFTAGKLEWKGSPMEVKGLPVEDGLLAHAPSRLVFNLRGSNYKVLRGSAALWDKWDGSAKFRILGDGKELWQSDTIAHSGDGEPSAEYLLNIDGVSELELVVDELGNYQYDASIWISPELGKMP
jgi:hypothetical protein